MISIAKIQEFEKFANTGSPPETIQFVVESLLKRDNTTDENAIKAYENYMAWWKTKFFDIEERYIAKENKALNLKNFIASYKHKSVYEHGRTKLEIYLFGNSNIKAVEQFVVDYEIKHGL